MVYFHSKDDEEVPRELRNTPEYKELMELKRVKRYKETFKDQVFLVILKLELRKCIN